MRKVVKQDSTGVIDLNKIDDNSKLVVKWSDGGNCSMLIEGKDNKIYGLDYRQPNLSHSWAANSKHEYVERALKQPETEVFEFSTYKELYEWLSQQ